MKRNFNLFTVFVLLLVSLCVISCREEKSLAVLDLSNFRYSGHAPVVAFHSQKIVGEFAENAQVLRDYSYRNMAYMLYVTAPGDSLHVTVLEFDNDAFALGFFLNSGLFHEKVPVVKGDVMEESLRAGRRLFIFRHSRLRVPDRGLLEKYVQDFPGYRAGLPQEFLSLPFRDRIPGGTSIQTRIFHGVPVTFPLLVQRYAQGGVDWNVSRSWNVVPESAYRSWISGLSSAGKVISSSKTEVLFNAGAGDPALATRLPGGRIVCVWGALDWKALRSRFEEAKKSVYDAQF